MNWLVDGLSTKPLIECGKRPAVVGDISAVAIVGTAPIDVVFVLEFALRSRLQVVKWFNCHSA